MTVYNGSAFIRKSIESILRQTMGSFELLIIDDGSTDSTVFVIQEIKDERIRLITIPHTGRANALNAGLRQSRFEIIAIQDADDIAVPVRLERQYESLKLLGPNTIISSWCAFFWDRKLLYLFASTRNDEQIKKQLALTCDFPNAAVMFYKRKIVECGLYHDIPFGLEDYDLFLRLKDSVRFYIIPEVLLFYRSSSASLSNVQGEKRNVLQYHIQEWYYENAAKEFLFRDKREELEYRGWREYFFGRKSTARTIWIRAGLTVLMRPRIALALIITFLPEKWFERFKGFRIKNRLQYSFSYFTNEMINLRNQFKEIIADGAGR
jgi:glycosyltransferase involved in cell wall biosynthesis